MEYERIKNIEAQLSEVRKDRANEAERMAVMAEIDAKQYTTLVHGRRRSDLVLHEAQLKETALKMRETADAAHALAGTTPGDFLHNVIRELEERLFSLEVNHLREADKLQNPKAYGLEDTEQLDRRVLEYEVGILTAQEVLRDLKGEEDGT